MASRALRVIKRKNIVNNHNIPNSAGYTQGKAPLRPSKALINNRPAQADSSRYLVPTLGNESLSACIQTAIISKTNRALCYSRSQRAGSRRWLGASRQRARARTRANISSLVLRRVTPWGVMHLSEPSPNRSLHGSYLTPEMDVSVRIYRLSDHAGTTRLQTSVIVIGPSKGSEDPTMARSTSVPHPRPSVRCRTLPVSQGQASH